MSIGRISAIAVAALVATATASPPPESPQVEPAASTTVLAMCGATCPQWRDDDVDRIIDTFITPLFPVAEGDELSTVAVRARGEAWPITGILRLLGLGVGDPDIFGPGGGAWPDVPLWKLTGLFDLTGDQSIRAGATLLEQAIAAASPTDRLIIYALSQGSQSANEVRERLTAQYPPSDPAPDIDFILQGDARVPNGGLLSRFPGFYLPILDWTFNGPELTDTPFDTAVINRRYDGFADFPLYPLNLVATLNAILGIVYLHTWPFEVDFPEEDPTSSPAYQGTDGTTDYYLFDSPDLPLFGPLRSIGFPEELIDVVEPFFRVLVELGYDRTIDAWVPTPARLIPRIDPARLVADLIQAVAQGIGNALALIDLSPLVKPPAEEPGVTPEPIEESGPAPELMSTGMPSARQSVVMQSGPPVPDEPIKAAPPVAPVAPTTENIGDSNDDIVNLDQQDKLDESEQLEVLEEAEQQEAEQQAQEEAEQAEEEAQEEAEQEEVEQESTEPADEEPAADPAA